MLARTLTVPLVALALLGAHPAAGIATPVRSTATASTTTGSGESLPGGGILPGLILKRPCLSCWAHH